MGLENFLRKIYWKYWRGEELWHFMCRSCEKQVTILRSGVPEKVQTGEARAECPECRNGMSKPLHVLRPWEDVNSGA